MLLFQFREDILDGLADGDFHVLAGNKHLRSRAEDQFTVDDITVCTVTNLRHNAIQTLKEINNTALCLFRKAAQAEMEVFLFCYIEPSQVIEKTSDFCIQIHHLTCQIFHCMRNQISILRILDFDILASLGQYISYKISVFGSYQF